MDLDSDMLKKFIISSILAVILFLAFKYSVGLFSKYKYLKYFLIFIPSLITILKYKYFYSELAFIFLAIIAGLFLFYSFSVFTNRYLGILTDDKIVFKNLLGQTGEINLKDIVKLEQKRNLLSFFREFRFLSLSIKTGITFIDANLDEYEINIFTKVFQGNNLFSKIIENANKCGNLKIRQYTI